MSTETIEISSPIATEIRLTSHRCKEIVIESGVEAAINLTSPISKQINLTSIVDLEEI